MRELIPLFFKPNSNHRMQNGPAALRRLWAISPNTVTAACIEAWKSTASEAPQTRLGTIVHLIQIIRLLPSPETAIASLLNGSKDPEFSLAVARRSPILFRAFSFTCMACPCVCASCIVRKQSAWASTQPAYVGTCARLSSTFPLKSWLAHYSAQTTWPVFSKCWA